MNTPGENPEVRLFQDRINFPDHFMSTSQINAMARVERNKHNVDAFHRLPARMTYVSQESETTTTLIYKMDDGNLGVIKIDMKNLPEDVKQTKAAGQNLCDWEAVLRTAERYGLKLDHSPAVDCLLTLYQFRKDANPETARTA